MNGTVEGRKHYGVSDYAAALIGIILTVTFCAGFLTGLIKPISGANGIDGQMVKEVLLFVLGVVLGAGALKKGVDQGATAALTPPIDRTPAPVPGQTTTTTSVTEATQRPVETTTIIGAAARKDP